MAATKGFIAKSQKSDAIEQLAQAGICMAARKAGQTQKVLKY